MLAVPLPSAILMRVELLTGFGLATAAGLNAYIPLLALGLLSRFTDLVTLPHGWTWLENGWVMAIVAALLRRRDRRRQDPGARQHQRRHPDLRPADRGRHRVRVGYRRADQRRRRPGRVRAVRTVDPGGDRRRCRAGGVVDEIGGATRRQCRHRGYGRAGAEHGRGRHQPEPGVRRRFWCRCWCWSSWSRWSGRWCACVRRRRRSAPARD